MKIAITRFLGTYSSFFASSFKQNLLSSTKNLQWILKVCECVCVYNFCAENHLVSPEQRPKAIYAEDPCLCTQAIYNELTATVKELFVLTNEYAHTPLIITSHNKCILCSKRIICLLIRCILVYCTVLWYTFIMVYLCLRFFPLSLSLSVDSRNRKSVFYANINIHPVDRTRTILRRWIFFHCIRFIATPQSIFVLYFASLAISHLNLIA